jgi:hypothetical protein
MGKRNQKAIDNLKDSYLSKEEKAHPKTKSERLKLGYSRAEWRKVEKAHKLMDAKLEQLVTGFILGLKTPEDPEIPKSQHIDNMVEKYDKLWRYFIKEHILNIYPKADQPPVRNRLLTIFSSYSEEMKKQAREKALAKIKNEGLNEV